MRTKGFFFVLTAVILNAILSLFIGSPGRGFGSLLWGETVKPQGALVNGLREGEWTFFYPGGGVWVKCLYRGGILDGPWEAFYPDGKPEAKGSYSNNRNHGEWACYYPNGSLYIRGHWQEHLKDGLWECRSSDGALWWKGSFSNDQKHGLWEAWSSGQPVESGNYYQGLRHGTWKIFHPTGKVQFIGTFHYGEKVGTWRQYDPQGGIVRSLDLGPGASATNTPPPVSPNPDPQPNPPKESGLRQRLDPTFRLAWAGPFLIASELSQVLSDQWRDYTILRLHGHMMKDFCRYAPPWGSWTIYLFRNRESYVDHTVQWIGQAPGDTAGFATADSLLVDAATGSGTLVHELVHAYVHTDFPGIPVWLNEGLASLFEQSAEVEGQLKGLVNWRLPILKKAIRENRLVPFNVLTHLDRARFNGPGIEIHYAEARYFCFYLQQSGLLQSFYREFRDHTTLDPTGTIQLLELLAKPSLEEIQQDWLLFINRLPD